MRNYLWMAAAVLVASLSGYVSGAPAPVEPPIRAAMRGYGEVQVQAQFFGEGAARSSWITFRAADAARATVVGSKLLADLLGFGDLKLRANATGLPGTLVELEGTGLWLLALSGSSCHVLFAHNEADLKALGARVQAAENWKPVPERAYPRWLDCFDNAGPGVWFGGGGAPVSLPDDFQWAKDHGVALCNQQAFGTRYVAPGVVDTSISDWFGAMGQQYDLPYRTLLWTDKPEWEWNRAPLPYLRPVPGWVGQYSLNYQRHLIATGPVYAPIPVPATERWTEDFYRRFSGGLNGDPNFVGGHALGEVPGAGVLELATVAGTPQVKTWWHEYLQKTLGLDLKQVGRVHKGRAGAYRTWDEVPVPTPRDFLGWNERCVNLEGTWEGRPDREKAGIAAQWYRPEQAPAGWQPVSCNDPMLLIYGAGGPADRMADYWLRRAVPLTAEQAGALKYLHIARTNGPGSGPAYCQAWLNGKPLAASKAKGEDFSLCLEVGDAARAGDNQLVLCVHGGPLVGYIFLGATPLRPYPYMTEPENRLWYDTVNFSASLLMRNLEDNLRATRQGDPNRPMKVMATINMLDLSQDLCARYGAYQHDTGGAGGYWAPMTGARLSRTHGLPWSCEQGGPPPNAAAMQGSMTYYLMYGNDAVDLVFSVTHYRDKPDVAAWVENNLALMHCIGKLDLPLPPIAILRSTRATRMGFGEPWNWDLGRGALQGVGRNFAYVEVPDISNGQINRFPVVIDDGTVLLTPEEVEGINRYVRAGGIFIAQHHTGRHTPSQADAWPLAAGFGLKVEPKLITPENYHQWPLGKIKFTAEQTLLPSLRGQTCEGSGVAIDYLDKTHTGAVGLTGQGDGVTPVAYWEDGTMAVAEVRQGKGRLLYLGSEFYLRMRDSQGKWVNDQDRAALLDEMLTGLGVPRDSWTGNPDVWAERWVSKNGVYDLYPVARMVNKGEEKVAATVALRRETPVQEVVEVSAHGHPRRTVSYQEGRLTLPEESYGLLQSRLYAAPRADVERAALRWFDVQRRHWRALEAVPAATPAQVVTTPEDVIPLVQGWKLTTGQTGEEWTQPGFADAGWKTVKLGSFAALGLPEDSVVQCRREIQIPAAWRGQQVQLVFDSAWSWGFGQQGRLWINGQPAPIKQPLNTYGATAFTLDATELAAGGKLTLALAVDGHVPDPTKPHGRPAGVTGLFYLQATPKPVATTKLSGPWLAASDVNVFASTEAGKPAKFTYLETRFTLPAKWPGQRLFLESPGPLGWVILNNHVVQTPTWMRSLDISGMVRREGENVLRWVPNSGAPDLSRVYTQVVPEASLVWRP